MRNNLIAKYAGDGWIATIYQEVQDIRLSHYEFEEIPMLLTCEVSARLKADFVKARMNSPMAIDCDELCIASVGKFVITHAISDGEDSFCQLKSIGPIAFRRDFLNEFHHYTYRNRKLVGGEWKITPVATSPTLESLTSPATP